MDLVNTERRNRILTVIFTRAELVDESDVQEIGELLLGLVAETQDDKLLISLEGVRFMSSQMLGKLIMLKNRCKARNIDLKLCDLSPELQEVFQALHLHKVIDAYPSEAEAFEAFDLDLTIPGEDDKSPSIDESRRQAESGDPASQYELAVCYAEGKGIAEDFGEALRWYRKAAEQNHSGAQYALGTAHAFGMHVDQDYDEALNWYRRAAELGNADAQFAMGTSYSHGLALQQDYVEAARWFLRAAESGHAEAQVNLGDMYAEGVGVDPDDSESVKWYRKAAQQGQLRAVDMLKRREGE